MPGMLALWDGYPLRPHHTSAARRRPGASGAREAEEEARPEGELRSDGVSAGVDAEEARGGESCKWRAIGAPAHRGRAGRDRPALEPRITLGAALSLNRRSLLLSYAGKLGGGRLTRRALFSIAALGVFRAGLRLRRAAYPGSLCGSTGATSARNSLRRSAELSAIPQPHRGCRISDARIAENRQ